MYLNEHLKKLYFLILISLFHFLMNGQVIIKSDNYYKKKSGVYITKSLNSQVNQKEYNHIEPQKQFKDSKNIAFLHIQNKKIALFEKMPKNGIQKKLGYLKETSIIEIDTIFYNRIYNDQTKEWSLTFDVWYGFRINGECYYADFKTHDFISYKSELKQFDQKFILVSQNTGYDEYYDNGYPEYFFVMILNTDNKIVYTSELLDFNYGDEFWESEFNVKTSYMDNGNFKFTIIGIDEKYTGIWNGKELKKEETR